MKHQLVFSTLSLEKGETRRKVGFYFSTGFVGEGSGMGERLLRISNPWKVLTHPLDVPTLDPMEIAFDTAKDTRNIEKHGVSLADAKAFEWDSAVIWPDRRKAYGEDRMIGLGYVGKRLFNVVFVDRDGIRRIVSLRKANLREVKRYAQA
jgi:uncharacterized DUF497 family protein